MEKNVYKNEKVSEFSWVDVVTYNYNNGRGEFGEEFTAAYESHLERLKRRKDFHLWYGYQNMPHKFVVDMLIHRKLPE